MGAVLELAGVRKSFGALKVIDDLSLAVASRELVVVDNQTAPNVPVAGKLKLIG